METAICILGFVSCAGVALSVMLYRKLKLAEKSIEDNRPTLMDYPLVQSERDRLKHELGKANERVDSLGKEIGKVKEENARIQATLAEKVSQLQKAEADFDERKKESARFLQNEFNKAIEGLELKFGSIASDKMRDEQKNLVGRNEEQMGNILKPLFDQLKKLSDLTTQTKSSNENLGEDMKARVREIGGIAASLLKVREALTSSTKIAGLTGEEILERKLKECGLQEGISYFIQTGSAEDRPDAQVCDSENRWLVIDSKLNLADYIAAQEEKDEALRGKRLVAHVEAIRKQIDSLARKNYPVAMQKFSQDATYLPVTVMFVPYEAPLLAALETEPSILQYAADRNVVILTPLTLNAFLRLVYMAWQQKNILDNANKITKVAKEFLSRMNRFLKVFEGFGNSIEQLRKNYQDASPLIVGGTGTHSIANSARQLMQLGVRLEGKTGKRKEYAECLLDLESQQNLLATDASDPSLASDSTGVNNPVELAAGSTQK